VDCERLRDHQQALRAFAAYYAIQALIAARGAWGLNRLTVTSFVALGIRIAVFGTAVEAV
jgi:hypothetical protein